MQMLKKKRCKSSVPVVQKVFSTEGKGKVRVLLCWQKLWPEQANARHACLSATGIGKRV